VYGGIFMTTTVQNCSLAVLNDTYNSIAKAEDDIEDNRYLLLSIAESMNDLCEKLNKLEDVLQRKQ
jgi:hypothetical protein